MKKERYIRIRNILFVSICFTSAACTTKPSQNSFDKEQTDLGQAALIQSINQVDTTGQLARQIKIETKVDKATIGNRKGFDIRVKDNTVQITGGSGAGVLYISHEVADRIIKNKGLTVNWEKKESPAMKWKGISLQLMKLGKYNFAITPKEFPFFYDKDVWLKFLDFMTDQRFNYIILWNRHPFDHFVKF